VLRREREAIFGRQWLCAGPLSQLARPGDYAVTPTARESVLVVRNESGELRAFANVCLHRGFPVCQGLSGVGEIPEASGMRVIAERSADFDANWKLAFEHPMATDDTSRVIQPALTRLTNAGERVVVDAVKPLASTRSRWTTTWLAHSDAHSDAIAEQGRVLDAFLGRLERVARTAAAVGFVPDSLALEDPAVRPALDAYVELFERGA
jgi:hypothetical protein